MKPRTKMHRQVLDLSKYLPNIEDKILSWAKKSCLQHKGYATKTRVICLDCGEKFPPDLVKRKQAVCPHCQTKLKIEITKKRTDKQLMYLAVADICDDFQVIRNFELIAYYNDKGPARYFLWEILQHWILPDGKREVIARNHTNSWYCDSWTGYMEIRDKGNIRKYDVYPYKYHPSSKIKKEYQKYGINNKLEGLTLLEAIKLLPNNPKAETLLKAKRFELVGYCNDYSNYIDRYWSAIKICLRNKYKIKDVKIWFDYLALLQYFGKDLNNSHYVCPADLDKEHNMYMNRKREKMRIAEMKRDYISILKYFGEFQQEGFEYPKNLKKEYQVLVERQKLDKLEKKKKELEGLALKYQQFIQPFLDIQICDKVIQIVPLQSIDEFKQEGDTLNHCVYTNEYFSKPNCLILSARIDGSSIETIEIDLSKMSISQCRGMQNKSSEYHDRIIRLVKRNMKQIEQRLTA